MEGLKKYWRRRVKGYQRLKGSERGRRKRVELGGKKRRRGWGVKMGKVKIPKKCSPKKLVLWVRDAYVRMMLGLANSIGVIEGGGLESAPQPKEYDDKMIIHMLVKKHGFMVPERACGNLLRHVMRPEPVECSWRDARINDAERLLRDMLSVGFKPDDASYPMVIDCFCKRGDVKMGFKLLKEMQNGGHLPGYVTKKH
ncbi:hypothetical protein RJT34_19356 [Clitoria ternatea]|uniref:Pentatricopeptide repeat-containing protein n=1 Tax=Clitoria ternatea TaxID=43366 RepID=A0AAN9IQV4_CLITE